MESLKELVLQEMERIHLPNYWGSVEQIENENKIASLTSIKYEDGMAIEDWLHEVYHNEQGAKLEYNRSKLKRQTL